MYKDLKDKVVLITGSNSGIGEATILQFALSGSKVVVTGRDETNIERVALKCLELSPNHYKPLTVIADLSKEEDVKRLVKETINFYGSIDILFNNAGFSSNTLISSKNILTSLDKVYAVNIRAILQLCHLTLPYLEITKGSIINMSSNASTKPYTDFVIEGMGHSSMDLFTKSLALEYGPKGIRVNAVRPGFVNSPLLAKLGLCKEDIEEFKNSEASKYPLRRVCEPEDVANTVLFLASSSSSFITGVSLPVDGGSLLI